MMSKAKERLQRIASHISSASAVPTSCGNGPRPYGNIKEPNQLYQYSTSAEMNRNPQESGTLWSREKTDEESDGLTPVVCIITGAGSGIGRATAILFARHGAHLCLCDIDGESVQKTADMVNRSIERECGSDCGDDNPEKNKRKMLSNNTPNSRNRVVIVVGDITDPKFAKRAIESAVSNFGAVHHLVLNAGYTWDGVVHKMHDKQFQSMLDVHLTANFRMIQAASPYMRDAAKREKSMLGKAIPRSIVAISSVSGLHGSAGQLNYATAKAGMVGMMKSLAKEWGKFNIRANCIVPGFIATRLTASKENGETIEVDGETVSLGIPQADKVMEFSKTSIPLGRIGTPEDVARSILMLTSDYASYITGQAIEITGGGWL